MSERQADVAQLADALSGLVKGDAVTLVTDCESIAATVTAVRWSPDEAVVTFEDRDADRRVRVLTERYDGWLDPVVDAYADPNADSAFRFDLDDPDLESLRPVGTLVDLRLVAVSDDGSRQRSRP